MDADNKYKIKREVRITPEMFYSEPFKALSASALRTLMRCLQKRAWTKQRIHGQKKTVYVDGDFIFPYGEAESLGIGTTQFWKNIALLIELGFMDLAYQGGRYQRDQHEKDYSRYRLSDRWKKYGTNDFVRSKKAKVLSPDFYIRKNLEREKTKPTSQKRSRQLHESEVEQPKVGKTRLHKSEVGGKAERNVRSLANAKE